MTQPRTVVVVLKPPGRGKWAPLELRARSGRGSRLCRGLRWTELFGVEPGQRIQVGGSEWRVCEVREE